MVVTPIDVVSADRRATLTEIQALRAVAVLAVVLFHLAPTRITGGFVGVDAFFVISGFLITAHLFREVADRGRIALGRFWARRIRRLLPAAFLVLAVTLAGTLLVLPTSVWTQVLTEIGASAIYLQNWRLASDAVDYFAADNLASPVQHYWSLSVEEQFYLVWPILILAAVGLATFLRRRGVPAQRSAVMIAAGLVFAASLIYSIRIAVSERSFGYFSTFSHAWEFAAGAALAMVLPRFSGRSRSPSLRAAAAWLGYGAVLWSILRFSGATPFPGFTALLPVAGVVSVIAAGTSTARWSPTRLVELRPVQYIGDVSYSLYLWHWPPIVLLPYLTGHDLTTVEKAAILIGSIAAAGMTKVWVEDRFRFGALAGLTSPTTFLVTLAVSAALVASCATPIVLIQRSVQRAQVAVEQALQTQDCFGAAAMLDVGCDRGFRNDPEYGVAYAAGDTVGSWMHDHVDSSTADPTEDCPAVVPGVEKCVFGNPDADTVIAVVGDSHARVWVPALTQLAMARGWQIRLIWRSSCRPALPEYVSTIPTEAHADCAAWKTAAIALIARATDIDLVVTTGATTVYGTTMTPQELTRSARAFSRTWAMWTQSGKPVLVLRDVPLSGNRTTTSCVARKPTGSDVCTLPVRKAAPRDPIDSALDDQRSPLLHSFDPGPAMCDATTCHFVVGGLITLRDTNHLTNTFALSMKPLLATAVDQSLE